MKRRPNVAKVTEKRVIVQTVYIVHVFQNISLVKEQKQGLNKRSHFSHDIF